MPFVVDDIRNRRLIDGMRSIGILLVILFHVLFGLSRVLPAADMDELIARFPQALNIAWQALGSEIIFFTSGFLLSYLLLREFKRSGSIDIRDYLVRRASRILPMYLLALLAYAPFSDFTPVELVLNLLFVSRIFGATTIIPQGWALEVLVQAYVILPFFLLLALHSRRPLVLVGALFTLGAVVRYLGLATDPLPEDASILALWHGGQPTPVQQMVYTRLWFRATPFLAGIFVAWLTLFRDPWLRSVLARKYTASIVLLLGIALLGVSGFLPVQDPYSFLHGETVGPQPWLWIRALQRPVFIVGVAATSLVLFYAPRAIPGMLARVFCWRRWYAVSRNIYSIYLFHLVWLAPAAAIVLRTIDRNGIRAVSPAEVFGIFILTAVFSILFASVLTRYVEIPVQRWVRRHYGRSLLRD